MTKSATAATTIGAAIRRWWQRQQELHELNALGAEERHAIARDVGVSDTDLCGLVRGKDSHEGLLPGLLEAAGLAPEEVSRSQPAIMRDMAVICSGCTQARHCRRALGDFSAWLSYHDYCPNAETIDGLRQQDPATQARLRGELGRAA
jgi:uncharacterized protein YjiS (DUF1127 family)